MSGSLQAAEAGADALFGFPPGTLEALGASESSQGTNLGSIGNTFQVLPSTAANPGYGLSSVDGNDPYSVGAYLSALQQGPANGSLAGALSLYQGGGTPNAAMSSFLSTLPGGVPAAPGASAPAGASSPASAGASPTTPGSCGLSPSCWLGALGTFLGGLATRGALILLAIILLLGAVYLFALRTQAVSSS